MDASPIQSVADNTLKVRSLDRTGLLCDNILELAGNPHNIYTTCELAADTTYTPKYTWLTKVEMKIAQWVHRFNKLPAESKLVWGTLVLMLAVGITIMSHGSTVAILTEMVLGVGFGLAMWAVTSLLNRQSLTMEGAVNAVMCAFLLSSIFVFITAGINAVKLAVRISHIKGQLQASVEQYRQSLLNQLSDNQLHKLKFAAATYDSINQTYAFAYNSEIINLTDDMLNVAIRGMGARTSCAEIQAVNKALNAGSRLSDLFIYTVNAKTGEVAYACHVCSRVLGNSVAGVITGLYPGI